MISQCDRRCISSSAFGCSPACAASQLSGLTLGTQLPACAGRCIPQVLPSGGFQLAPSASLPALLSNSTAGLRRLLHLGLCPSIDLGLAPPINLQASPSNPASDSQSVRYVLLASSFRPAFDLRLQPTFRLSSRTQPPTQSSIRRTFRFCLPISLRLAPVTDLLASPSNSTSNPHRPSHPLASPSVRPSTRVSDRLSSSTSDSTSDFHRWISSGGALNQLPTCVGY
jgi:hypothetical protein